MAIKAILFDVFGTVVDWRGSLIADFSTWGAQRGLTADWPGLVDAWRGAYAPSMNRVRHGERPWANLDTLHAESLADLAPRFGLPTPLAPADATYLITGWHRLAPWPDAVAGLIRLRTKYTIGTLSNGNVALLVAMAKHAGLPWDMVFSAELFRHYKPDAETYLGAAALLGLPPDAVMLAAAHPSDLSAARAHGLRTAYIARPAEYGPNAPQPGNSTGWDYAVTDIPELASRLGC
jgi:2-haloacid dehalogenase